MTTEISVMYGSEKVNPGAAGTVYIYGFKHVLESR